MNKAEGKNIIPVQNPNREPCQKRKVQNRKSPAKMRSELWTWTVNMNCEHELWTWTASNMNWVSVNLNCELNGRVQNAGMRWRVQGWCVMKCVKRGEKWSMEWSRNVTNGDDKRKTNRDARGGRVTKRDEKRKTGWKHRGLMKKNIKQSHVFKIKIKIRST